MNLIEVDIFQRIFLAPGIDIKSGDMGSPKFHSSNGQYSSAGTGIHHSFAFEGDLTQLTKGKACGFMVAGPERHLGRSEEHTSELQSRGQLVCRLLLEDNKSTTE